MKMNITKELKHCLYEGEAFYSIPYEGVLGNKIIVIASNKVDTEKKIKELIKLYQKNQIGGK